MIGNRLSVIKENFQIIKQYRNDVMHAHYMDYDTYKKAVSLFKDVNTQLDIEINTMHHGYEPVQANTATMTAVDELLEQYGDTPMSEVEKIIRSFPPEIIERINRIIPQRPLILSSVVESIQEYRDIVHNIMEEIGAISFCNVHDDYWYNTGRYTDEDVEKKVLKTIKQNPLYAALDDKQEIISAIKYILDDVAIETECPYCRRANNE